MTTLASPWLLLLLIPAVGVVLWAWHSPTRPAVTWSSLIIAKRVPPTLATRTRWLLPALRIGAVVALVVLLARPIRGDQETTQHTDGVAIELLIDRSGSMRALDMDPGSLTADRLHVARVVAEDFVLGEGDLLGREHDLVGLISFASIPRVDAPLTYDYEFLSDAIGRTRIATEQEGAGTAIGDALALAVARLADLQDRPDLDTDDIASRVVILLTDGEDTDSEIPPLQAAEMAAAMGVKVYTIAVGTPGGGLVPVPVIDPFGRNVLDYRQVNVDVTTLKAIAETTHGAFFQAGDAQGLRDVYAAIDKLERTAIAQQSFLHVTDLAVDRVRVAGWLLPPLLLIPIVLLALEILASATRWRTVP
jgi:Ca-activated chloride channel family protein